MEEQGAGEYTCHDARPEESVPSGSQTHTACLRQPANNNGNVGGYYYKDNINSLTHTMAYTYDGVNRLHTAVATGGVAYSQTFTYTGDGSAGLYGNLRYAPSGPGCVTFTYSASNNHISGYTYDAAGDVTNDGTDSYQWDAEGHLLKVINGAGTAISTNTYNALGQRVRDVTTTATTDEAYGADGSLLWRYTGSSSNPSQRAFVPFEGGILAEYYGGSPGGAIFDHPDQLGTLSAASDYTGNNFQERLYYPFGEFWTGAGSLGMHQEFAKLPDYDAETDQYNTANRHYSPMGRWMSPDPGGLKYVDMEDPQTWNMYAYVRDNPTTLTDPTGLIYNSSGNYTCDANGGGVSGCSPNTSMSAVTLTQPQDPAQNTAYTATILGQKVPVNIIGGTADDRSAIRGRLDAAFGDINQHAGDLSASDVNTIHNIRSVSVDDSSRTGVDVKTGAYDLKPGYVMAEGSSTAWIASTIAHDAYHVTQFQHGEVYNRQTAQRLEHEANQIQMRVGAKFGLKPAELNYIRNDTHTLYNTPPY